METSEKDIYACGDAVEIDSICYGNWQAALESGNVAGANATGDSSVNFRGFVSSVIFEGFGLKILSAGFVNYGDESLDHKSFKSDNDVYKNLTFKDDKLIGCILIQDLSVSVNLISSISSNKSKDEVLKLVKA